MPFPDALKKFSENGSFELTDSQIFLKNIYHLEKRINQLKDDKPEIAFYQIRLSNVQLIPGPLPLAEMPEHVLSGAAVEHSPRPWHGKLTDVALVQMGAANGFNAPLNFRDPEESQEQQLVALKESLLSLLALPTTWNSIELDHVFFHKNQNKDYDTTKHFYNDLLNSLAKNYSLKELSIKPFSLTKHRNSLVNFLTQNTQLESLHLEISEANRQDWLELSQILAMHPKLKSFNLGNSILDVNAYSALTNLLDENYRIEITLTEPTDKDLLKAYEPLKQRLSKSGLVRFKEDHLSQDKLLQVAITALGSLQKLKSSLDDQIKEQALLERQFDFLLANQGHLAITSSEKEDWVKSIEVLPSIYKNHEEYLKNESSLVQLHLDELVPNGTRTVSYVLLERALETENPEAMRTLLNAKANLFEFPDNDEEPFLVKVLQSKGDLKRLVVDHIREDQRLTELASECLIVYPDLSNTFGDLKIHLDHYSSHLVKRDNPYTLLSISNEILGIWRRLLGIQNPATTRGKECAQIYLDLDKSLQIIKADPEELTYNALRKVQIIMQSIKENSSKALRGILNKSFLHEEVVNLVDRFNRELEASKDQVNVKKDETIKHKDEEINQLHEKLERERAEAQEKQAKLETKQAEMETKQTKLEAENAEIKAENADIKKTLNSILQQINFNVHISEDTSASSVSQDQASSEVRGFFRP